MGEDISAYLEVLDREGLPHFSTTDIWGWIFLYGGLTRALQDV